MTTDGDAPELTDFDLVTLRRYEASPIYGHPAQPCDIVSLDKLLTFRFLEEHRSMPVLIEITPPGRIVLSLAERARKAEAATAWEPIGTAPKDGTPVLLGGWYRNPYAPDPQPATFMQTAGFWITCGGGEWVRGFANQPTHWRPLHAPPEKEADRHD